MFHVTETGRVPPELVLVPVLHQAFGADDGGQLRGQQSVVSVDEGQTLVLQLQGNRKFRIHVQANVKANKEVFCLC